MSQFADHYTRHIQLSEYQAGVIAASIGSRSACKLLVFGVGRDTPLWLAQNKGGSTIFLESDQTWADQARSKNPDVNIIQMPTFDLTVARSLTEDVDLAKYPLPRELFGKIWDVILIDAPPGATERDPGRAIAIFWSSLISDKRTHIFVDDYERPLERQFADRLLRNAKDFNNPCAVIPNSRNVSGRELFWRIGTPLA